MGNIFLAYIRTICINKWWLKCNILPRYCGWPRASIYDHGECISGQRPVLEIKNINRFVHWTRQWVSVLKWPPELLDLNPIVHCSNLLKRKIQILDVQSTNLEEFRGIIITLWTQNATEYIVKIMSRNIIFTIMFTLHRA